MERYSRQTMLPEIGEAGQLKLKAAKVLIVGVGGLGSPIALYLAGAGVGTIGLADDDEVSLSNLQRQILYTEEEVGDLKAICASMRISALNREIKVNACPGRLSKENARDLIGQYDIIVDGCDNFATRYLLSDVCSSSGNRMYTVLSADLKDKCPSSTTEKELNGKLIVTSTQTKKECYTCLLPRGWSE